MTETTNGKLEVVTRVGKGKGVARKLRAEGQIPAVLYGRGEDSLRLAASPRDIRRAMDPERKLNTVFTLTIKDVDGSESKDTCIITDYQLHPTRDEFLHVDFLRVDLDKEVTAVIPVEYTGRSAGVLAGGKLRTFRRTVRIAAKPNEIPVALTVDVTPLDAGQSMRLKSLSAENARLLDHPETVMAHVNPPRAAKADKDKDEKKK